MYVSYVYKYDIEEHLSAALICVRRSNHVVVSKVTLAPRVQERDAMHQMKILLAWILYVFLLLLFFTLTIEMPSGLLILPKKGK